MSQDSPQAASSEPGSSNPNSDEEFLPKDVCPCLRTKTLHLNTEYRRSAFEERFTADTALFTCMVTMCDWGPDEADVLPNRCRPGRACYDGGRDIT